MLVMSVSDRMIFFETGPSIPFFEIRMSLESFSIIFPFILAVTHFTVLLQNTERNFMEMFLGGKNTDRKTLDRFSQKLIKICIVIMFYFLPFFAVVIFQIRLSAWQNWRISLYHLSLVFLDFLLIVHFSSGTRRLRKSLKHILAYHFKKGYFSPVSSVFLFFSFSRREILMIRKRKSSLAAIKLKRLLTSIPSSWALILISASLLNMSFLFSIISSDEPLSDYTVNSIIISAGSVFEENPAEYCFLFPRLSLPNENLSAGSRINFSGRSFRFADFRGSVLNLNSFHLAHTENADFTESRWVSKTGE